MQTAEITDDELNTFTIIERVVSVLSLLGCIFIIATFCTLKSFHKPINRLVFYASMYGYPLSLRLVMFRFTSPRAMEDRRGPRCAALTGWQEVTETIADHPLGTNTEGI